ncbi:hypothetical protein DJ72_06040, partial [Halorubrum distributum]
AVGNYCESAGVPAVLVTASHNPPEFNGIKLVGDDGVELSVDVLERIERRVLDDEYDRADWREAGATTPVEGAVDDYADQLVDAVDREAKVAAEREAMADLAGPLPERVRDAWEAYEARESPEAVLVKECDLLDTCLQAVVYERGDRYDPERGEPDAFREYDDLDEFFATSEPRLRTEAGRELFGAVRDRYRVERDGA